MDAAQLLPNNLDARFRQPGTVVVDYRGIERLGKMPPSSIIRSKTLTTGWNPGTSMVR
jgi:hypothetical protein